MYSKEELRKIYKSKRFSLSKPEVKNNSEQICQNLIKNLLPKIYQKNCKKIFSLYLSSYNEVSCNPLIKYFIENDIKFSYPRITEKESSLEFILNEKEQKFIPNKFYPKILEPNSNRKITPNIIILPLLAFDSDLSRLGMGGGFFDRTINHLKSQGKELITIGLAYDLQRFEGILPIEKTDQTIDFIVSSNIILSSDT